MDNRCTDPAIASPTSTTNVGHRVPGDPCEPISKATWNELRERFPTAYASQVALAIRLTLDLEACDALLRGGAVDPVRLDPIELARSKRSKLVSLVSPLEAAGLADLAEAA